MDESVIRSIVESKKPPHLLEPALDNLAIVPSKRSLKETSMQIAKGSNEKITAWIEVQRTDNNACPLPPK
jgi:hypothetical protein